jgi:putative MATE family efflux protein
MKSIPVKYRDSMLGEEKIGRLLFKLSVPSAIGMLVHAMYNVVDMIFIGRSAGANGIGGLIIAFPFQMLIVGLAGIIGIGASSMVSRNLGAGNRQKASTTVGNAFIMAIILGICCSVLVLTFLDSLLKLFGATDTLIGYSREYLAVILYGSLFITFGMVANNIVRSEGRAVMAMSTMLIGTILNLALDPIFIFALEMGIRGAAIATVISQFVSAIILLWFFISGKSSLELRLRHLKVQKEIAREIIAVGFPSFVRQAGGSVMMIAVNNMLARYGGDIFIACFGIINRFFIILFMTILGIVQGLQPIVGYNYGAGKIDRVNESLRLSITVATAISCLIFAILILFPGQMVALFSNEAELIRIGTKSVRLVILAIPFVGFQIIAASFFQAIGKARPALILGMSRQFFLLIPLVLLLPRLTGSPYGVFMAFPGADGLAVILTGIWFSREVKLLKKKAPIDFSN